MSLPIGFFAPLPLPMMIPFMGIQSAVMAEQFGTMFQYGKRRISAMSNEEFNKLTPKMLQERMTREIAGMIPQMQEQIQAMRPMVELIIKEFAQYILLATKAVGEIAETGTGVATGNISYLAEHLAHGHLPGVAGHPSSQELSQIDDPTQFVPPVPTSTSDEIKEDRRYKSPFTADSRLPRPITHATLHDERTKIINMITNRYLALKANPGSSSLQGKLKSATKVMELFLKIYWTFLKHT